MSEQTIDRVALRLGEHARNHSLDDVSVVLHGGEPLLAGAGRIRYAAEALRAAVPNTTHVDLSVQTNGTLLTESMVGTLSEQQIGIGVSLDGGSTAHDRERRTRQGKGSYEAVQRGLELLQSPQYRHLFNGLLCTVDTRNDPLEVYAGLTQFNPPKIDFLLPHGSWANPPPGKEAMPSAAPYADWLVKIFDRWYDQPRPATDVRLFTSVISLLFGGPSYTEALGLAPVDLIVVETNGDIEQGDALKAIGDGFAHTGMSVFSHDFDDALGHPAIAARQRGMDALADDCRRCPIVGVCGGGLYAHRYREGSGFTNPTVYCADQLRLINHIRERVSGSIAAASNPPAARAPQSATDTTTYHLSRESFDAFSRGYGDEHGLAVLRSAQLSKRLLLLREMGHAIREAPQGNESLATAWTVLETCASTDRDSAALLEHPFIAAWATRGILSWRRAKTSEAFELDPEISSYLVGLAIAAAIRKGEPTTLATVASGGQLAIPTVGLAYDLGDGPVTVRLTTDYLTIEGSAQTAMVPAPFEADTAHWFARRDVTVHADSGTLTVEIEDLDPFRTCFGKQPMPRLSTMEFNHLRGLLHDAWQHINSYHEKYAMTMRSGLRSLVPLRAPQAGSTSASADTAFGSVAASLPSTGDRLALLLIHETQHMKLGGVLDLVDLYDRTATSLHHAPWRADPRPVGSLLQGAFAHIGVTDYWRIQRTVPSEKEPAEAEFEFALWLEQTKRACATLIRSDALIGEGPAFVHNMGRVLAGWDNEPVDTSVAEGVVDIVDATALRWRLTNRAPVDRSELLTAWRTGQPCPSFQPGPVAAGAPAAAAGMHGLAEAIRHNLLGPRPSSVDTMTRAYLDGDHTQVIDRCTATLTANPADTEAWIGLGLVLRRRGQTAEARAILEYPDVARSLWESLRGVTSSSPVSLAAWMAAAATEGSG